VTVLFYDIIFRVGMSTDARSVTLIHGNYSDGYHRKVHRHFYWRRPFPCSLCFYRI